MKTPKRILERRKSVRVNEALPFRIGHKGFELEAVTVNIGTSGAMCLVDRDIPMMTQLDILLSVPAAGAKGRGSSEMSIKGVVVRKEKDLAREKFYIAIFFSKIFPKDQKLLKKFIDTHA